MFIDIFRGTKLHDRAVFYLTCWMECINASMRVPRPNMDQNLSIAFPMSFKCLQSENSMAAFLEFCTVTRHKYPLL